MPLAKLIRIHAAWPAFAFAASFGWAAPSTNPELLQRYETMLIQSPGSPQAFDKLVQLATEANKLEELDAAWKKAAADGKGSAYVLLRGRLADRLGRSKDANRLFADAVKADPNNRAAWQLLGANEQALGHAEQAINAEQKVLSLGAQAEERLAAFRVIAQLQQRLLRNDDAVKTLERMVAEFPDDRFVLAETADALIEAGRATEARVILEKLDAQGDPFQKLQTRLRLAELDAAAKGSAAAIPAYEQILADSAETSWIHREARQRIEDLFRRQEDLPGLVTYYQQRLKSQPRDVEAIYRLGNALASLGRNDEAADQYRKAIELAPERADFLQNYAVQMLAAGKFDESVAALRKLARNDPKNPGHAEALGEALWKQSESTGDASKRQAAIEAWTGLAPADSKDVPGILRVANLLATHDLKNEALPFFDRALGLDPNAFDQRESAARILIQLGRKRDADAMLAGAISADRATPENYAALATAYRRLDQAGKALEITEAGLARSPHFFALLVLKARLLAEASRWSDLADLHSSLLEAAPGSQYMANLDRQYIEALENCGKLDQRRDELLKAFDSSRLSNESDLRVLARMLMRVEDGPASQRVLLAARDRFPASLDFVRMQADYEQRFGTPASQRQVLRRLADLDAGGRAQWLVDLARSWQAEEKWDEALKAAAERIALSPANAESYSTYADICFAAGRPDAGIAMLQEAVRLASEPVAARQRLARAYAEIGNSELALRAEEDAFEQETDPAKKLQLVSQLAEYYLQAGKIEELIDRLKARRQQDEGTRYSAYLAQIYLRQDDYASAREELARGLAIQPRDAALLRQLLSLSEREQNGPETLRYAQMLAEVEPTVENRLHLVEALVSQGESDSAVSLLRTIGPDALSQGGDANRVVQLLGNPILRNPAITLLRDHVATGQADWRSMLNLATLLIAEHAYPEADGLLRQIQALDDAQLLVEKSTITPSPDLTAATLLGGSSEGAQIMFMQQGANEMITSLQQARRSRRSMRGYRGLTGGLSLASVPQNYRAATIRASALAARAYIAVQQGREKEFLADWRREAEQRKLSPEQRIFELLAIQAQPEVKLEAEALANAPDATFDQLTLAISVIGNQPGEVSKAERDRLAVWYRRLAAAAEVRFNPAAINAIYFLLQMGQKDEAGKMLDRFLSARDPRQASQTTTLIMACLAMDRLDTARDMFGELVAGTGVPASTMAAQQMDLQWQIGIRMLQKKERRQEGLDFLVDMLRKSYGSSPTQVPSINVRGRSRTHYFIGASSNQLLSPDNIQNAVPLATQWFSPWSRDRLRLLYNTLKAAGAVDEFLAALKKQESSLGDDAIYPRLATIYVTWWDGRQQEAIEQARQLAKAYPSENLDVFLASMLIVAKDYDGAEKVLAAAPAGDKDDTITQSILLLTSAALQRDAAKAKIVATGLEKLHPQSNERYAAASVLRSLNLDEDAERLQNSARQRSGRSGGGESPLAKRMSDLTKDKDRSKAVSIARSILLNGTPNVIAMRSDELRSRAIETLSRFSALEDLINETAQQLQKQPDSVKLNALMAELARNDSSARALPYYQKLVALRPQDQRLRHYFAGMLRNSKRSNEAADIYRKSMQDDLDGILQEDYSDAFEAFQAAGRLPEFVEIFATAIKPEATEIAEQYGHVFRWYGDRLAEAGELAGAERMYRLGLDAGVTDSSLQQSYLQLLLRQNRQAEAQKWIAEALFPTPQAHLIFSWANSPRNGSPWNSWTSTNSGRAQNIGAELMRQITDPAALEDFRKRSQASLARRPNDRAARTADFFVRIRCRDKTVLDDIRKALGQKRDGSNPFYETTFAQAIAFELVEWPEARSLALDVSLVARKAQAQASTSLGYYVQITEPLIELALQCNRPEVARTEIKGVIAKLKGEAGSVANQLGTSILFQIADQAMAVDLGNEALELLEAVQQASGRRESLRRDIERYLPDFRLAAGKPAAPQAAVWQTTFDPTTSTGTLAWRLGSARAFNGRDGRVTVTRRDLAALDGKYDLELIAETPPNIRQRIALIKGAKYVGRWEGKIPPGTMRVTGVLRAQRNSAVSYAGLLLNVAGGTNLIRNPDLLAGKDGKSIDGWSAPVGVRQIARGGPDGQTVAVDVDAPDRQVKLVGELIPVTPDRDYEQMTWYTSIENGGCNLGVAFLDENKKEIDTDSCSNWNETGYWNLLSQFLTSRENSPSGYRRIPRKARWMRPYLECSGTVRLSGLRISELPQTVEPEED